MVAMYLITTAYLAFTFNQLWSPPVRVDNDLSKFSLVQLGLVFANVSQFIRLAVLILNFLTQVLAR